jgi:hypothetical protein
MIIPFFKPIKANHRLQLLINYYYFYIILVKALVELVTQLFVTCSKLDMEFWTLSNVKKTIRSLHHNVIVWPDKHEQKELVMRILHEYANIIGSIVWVFVDGTMFTLTYKPQSDDAPDNNGWKFQYS